MRRFTLFAAAAAVLLAAPTQASATTQVRNIQVTPGVWEQWLEPTEDPRTFTGCTRQSVTVSFDVLPGTQVVSQNSYLLRWALRRPNDLTLRGYGEYTPRADLIGHVSLPVEKLFTLTQNWMPDHVAVIGTGRNELLYSVFGTQDLIRNPLLRLYSWRSLSYVGVSKPVGSCAAAGLPTYFAF